MNKRPYADKRLNENLLLFNTSGKCVWKVLVSPDEGLGIRKASLRRSYFLKEFTVGAVESASIAELEELLNFYNCRGGEYETFRFLDVADYKAGTQGRLKPVPGTTNQYQLVKQYGSYSRFITKPDVSTVKVFQGLNQVEAQVDAATGRVVVADGVVPDSWTGNFDCHVAFTSAPEHRYDAGSVKEGVLFFYVSSCTLAEVPPAEYWE